MFVNRLMNLFQKEQEIFIVIDFVFFKQNNFYTIKSET